MARTGVAIIKEVAFRDSVQPFQNVYFYESLGVLGPGDASGIVSYLVNRERPLHGTQVLFTGAKVWSASGTPQQNQMIHEETLTGAGTASPVSSMDRERAFLIQWPAGFDVRGHPVTLKKWFHACGNPTGVSITDGIIANTTGFSAASRTALQGLCSGFRNPDTLSEAWTLCSRNGRETTGGPVAHPYFEHHQLGDLWRD